MIEGYSVDEAASVLGVPKGRVWELLARGILAGTPEDGGGMRVYLQGRPMESIVGRPLPGRSEPNERPTGTNGNGGEHGQPGFEASPFRELLTEFRNLTERYGQALLALGESRGEVASLRTRVELIEARVDLRLPSPPLVQWSPPQPAPPVAQSEPSPNALDEVASALAPAFEEPEASGAPVASTKGADVDEGPGAVIEPPAIAVEAGPAPARPPKRNKPRPRRRRQGARSATEGFADALARAEDPTVTQLPGGDEAQAAFNELRERIRRETLAAEAREPAQAREPAEANEPTEALPPEPDDAIGLAATSAPAEAVELDPLLADEELGGAIQEPPTSAGESPAVEEAPAMEETAPVSPNESVVAEEPLAVAEAEAPAPAYSHEWDEPDWIAEEDVDWGTSEVQAPQEAFAMGESPEIGWGELPAATIEQPAEQLEAPAAEQERDASEASGRGVEVEPFESFATDTSTSHASEVETPGSTLGQGGARSEARAAPAGDVRGQGPGQRPEQAAGPEEELMWLGDEFRAGPVAWSSPGRVSTLPRQTPEQATVSEAEDEALARLAVERGWDDAELDAIRSLLAQPGHVDLQGTEHDATASATPDVETPDVETPGAEGRSAEMRDEIAPPEEARAGEAREDEQRDEEAFDWERGPSAWNPPPLAREPPDFPGAVELDQAMAAFEVSAWSKEAVSHADDEQASREAADPDQPTENREVQQRNSAEAPSAPPARAESAPAADVPGVPPQSTSTATQPDAPGPASAAARPAPPSVITPDPERETDDDWLRDRRGPAASAYRRLRRLFP